MVTVQITFQPEPWWRRYWRTQRSMAWLLLILILAAGLRLFHLGALDYSFGELSILLDAQAGDVFRSSHPLFSALTLLWHAAGLDTGRWTTRLLPLLFGLSTVCGAYALGAVIADSKTGLLSALLIATVPTFIGLSQEITWPSLQPALLLWPSVFLFLARKQSHIELLVLYVISMVALLYAGPPGVAVFIGHIIWFVFSLPKRTDMYRGIVVVVFVIALYMPSVSGRELAVAVERLTSSPISTSPFLILEAFALVGLITLGKRNRHGATHLLILSGAPLVGCAVALSDELFTPSLIALFLLPLWIAAAHAIRSIPSPAIRGMAILGAAGSLAVISLFPDLVSGMESRRGGMFAAEDCVRHIRSQWRDGDAIAVPNSLLVLPIAYYGLPDWPVETVRNNQPSPLTLKDARLNENAETAPSKLRTANRVWCIHDRGLTTPLAPPDTKRWLDAHLYESAHIEFPCVDLYLFERKIDGRWTQQTQCIYDDGSTKRVVYDVGTERRYTKVEPKLTDQSDKVITPRENLSLEFADSDPDALVIELVNEPNPRTHSFRVTNRSENEVCVILSAAATAGLVEFAGFDAADSSTESYGLVDASMRAPYLPSAHLSVELNQTAATADAHGETSLDAGAYELYVYRCGSQVSGVRDADVIVQLGGKSYYAAIPFTEQQRPMCDWYSFGEFVLPYYDGRVNIGLSSMLPQGAESARADLAYLAFAPKGTAYTEELRRRATFHTEEVTMQPYEERTWLCRTAAPRLDVWATVCSLSARGAYHIFTAQAPRHKPAL